MFVKVVLPFRWVFMWLTLEFSVKLHNIFHLKVSTIPYNVFINLNLRHRFFGLRITKICHYKFTILFHQFKNWFTRFFVMVLVIITLFDLWILKFVAYILGCYKTCQINNFWYIKENEKIVEIADKINIPYHIYIWVRLTTQYCRPYCDSQM